MALRTNAAQAYSVRLVHFGIRYGGRGSSTAGAQKPPGSNIMGRRVAVLPRSGSGLHGYRHPCAKNGSAVGLASNTLGYVWVGAERSFFESATRQRKKEFLQVLFYGQFIPLHGIDTIIEAARILQDPQIRWTLIGRGQEASRIRALIAQTPLPTLHWVDWIAYDKLHEWIASADICLGIFGTSEKAASVIPNKVFQIIASGCPLITRDSSAIRELLGGASPGIRLIPAGDARALAEAIRDCTDQINDLPRPCHEALREHIRSNAIATQFLTMVENFFPKTSVSK